MVENVRKDRTPGSPGRRRSLSELYSEQDLQVLFDELKAICHNLRHGKLVNSETLRTTALLGEVVMRLLKRTDGFFSRDHVLNIGRVAARDLLEDLARKKRARAKVNWRPISIEEAAPLLLLKQDPALVILIGKVLGALDGSWWCSTCGAFHPDELCSQSAESTRTEKACRLAHRAAIVVRLRVHEDLKVTEIWERLNESWWCPKCTNLHGENHCSKTLDPLQRFSCSVATIRKDWAAAMKFLAAQLQRAKY